METNNTLHKVAMSASITAQPYARRQGGVAPFLLGAALLGTIGIFVHAAGADPLTTTWFRCAFGLVGLTVWLLIRRQGSHLRLTGSTATWVLAASLLMVLSWALFFDAIGRTSAGVAVVLFHVQPLWVLVLGRLWLGESVSRPGVIAVCIAMFGLALATGIVEHTALFAASDELPHSYWIGVAECLVGALCTACVTIIAKRLSSLPAGVLAWWQCAVGTVVLSVWPIQQGWPAPGMRWVWLVCLGLVHTGLAYTLIYAGMAHLSAARIAVLQFVYPATAVALDWLFLGHSLSPGQLTGVAVMAVAIWFSERKPTTRAPTNSA